MEAVRNQDRDQRPVCVITHTCVCVCVLAADMEARQKDVDNQVQTEAQTNKRGTFTTATEERAWNR